MKLLTSEIVFNLGGEQRTTTHDTVAEWMEEEAEPEIQAQNERLELVEKAEKARQKMEQLQERLEEAESTLDQVTNQVHQLTEEFTIPFPSNILP